jgi:ferredoxin
MEALAVPFSVRVDPDSCEGHGLCLLDGPTVFRADADGYAQVVLDAVPDELRSRVEDCVRSCPARAISIEG